MGYISKNYKIVIGNQNKRGVWFGPIYPNGTNDGVNTDCATGCLFDIFKDPTEHVNLKDSNPTVWKMMLGKLVAAGKEFYQTDYAEPGTEVCLSKEQATAYYVGHNKCIYGGPGYQPSLPADTQGEKGCNETTPRVYLGPLCFKTLPPGIPPATP